VLTRVITPAAPFVNNVIPISAIDPIALKIAQFLPTTNQLDACGHFNYATGANQRQYQIPVKVDYTLSQKQTVFVRYMLSNNYTPLQYDASDPLFTEGGTGQENNIHAAVIGHTYTIRPTVISTHIAANRGFNPRFTPRIYESKRSGFPITSFVPHSLNMNVTNGFSLGRIRYFNTLDFFGNEDLTIIKANTRFSWAPIHSSRHARAKRSRGERQSQLHRPVPTVGGTIGLWYSDFFTGRLNNLGQGRPFYDNDKSDYYGLYVQDAWACGRALSVNIGLL
jgi:hypothetical protein